MSTARLSRVAATELADAARRIARDNPPAARGLRSAVEAALDRLGRFPESGPARPELAAAPIRFWFLPRYPYVLVYDSEVRPPLVLRVVHAARDFPALLRDAPR
jgi:toxin ParE1/3/4